MKKHMASAVATVALLFCGSFVSAQVIDGNKDASYGTALSVQRIQTGFGDNTNEWNAAYATVSGGNLNLMFTGNLEANFNKLEIFIASTDAVNTNVLTTAGNDGSGVMDGMTFDYNFRPDYHIIARRGFDGVNKFDLDFADLGAGTSSGYFDIAAGINDGFSATTGTGVNANPIAVGFDNSNVAGIGGDAGAVADSSAAVAVNTGLELSISLADIGGGTGAIRVMLLQNNDNHDFLSNQTLGGLPVGTGNLGSPASSVNFNAISGAQFFVVQIPEPTTVGLLAMGAAGLVLRRRR